MDNDPLLNEIDLLRAQLSELAQALALTNEKLNKFIEHESNLVYDDGRLWMKLGIKKISQMSTEELKLLNEEVANRQIGKRIFSKEAIKPPTAEESLEFYKDKEKLGYDEAIVSTAKFLVARWIEELQEDEANEKLRQ
jgi:hypothetical protein